MRKKVLISLVSIIVTALFIGLAISPVTAQSALSLDTTVPITDKVETETKTVTTKVTTTSSTVSGGTAEPAQTMPPEEVCPNCVTAILKSAIATIPSRQQSIEEFVNIVLSIPDMTLTEFNDALINWTLKTRLPILLELGDYLFNVYDFKFDIESALDTAFEALDDLAKDLYSAMTNPEHPAYPLKYPILTTTVTVAEIMFLFVIITSGALLIQCIASGLNNEEQSTPASVPGSAPAQGSASTPALEPAPVNIENKLIPESIGPQALSGGSVSL